MASNSTQLSWPRGDNSPFPLRFKTHDFSAYCYNTRRCQVIYDRSAHSYAEDKLTPPPPPGDYRKVWQAASYMGVDNFPPAAKVTWTSLEGVELEAEVDIGAIFKDERVLYTVPDSEITESGLGDHYSPNIYLEINDRCINVYMSAFITTKTEQRPGNQYSMFRRDVVLAWSSVY